MYNILLKTCHINLNINLNIYILHKQIEINSITKDDEASLQIIGTRFQDNIRGSIKEIKQSVHKKRKDFSNQCSVTTIYTRDNQKTNVNFKVFNNGNIIITGMKQDNDIIKHAIKLFMQNIINLTYTYTYETNCKQKFLDMFDNDYNKYSKFIHNHHIQLLKINNILNKNVDIGIYKIIGTDVINELTLEKFIDNIWTDDIYNFIQLFYICYYYSSKDFINILNNTNIQNILTSENKVFPISFVTDLSFIEQCDVIIENINAMINFDFIIDRSKFYNYILENFCNNETKHNEDFVDFISFEQSMYQGINIKYKVKSNKNKQKYITFLIFQEGKILVSGLNSEEQLQKYSDKIIKLIYNNRSHYEINKSIFQPIPTNIQLYPSFNAILNNEQVKILHYTKLIELNPRNYYIVKNIKFI